MHGCVGHYSIVCFYGEDKGLFGVMAYMVRMHKLAIGLYGERGMNGEVCLCGEDAYTIEGDYTVDELTQ